MREVHVMIDGHWIRKELWNVEKGQTFRMFNNDGTLVFYNDRTEHFATSEPYYSDESQMWMIDVDTTEYAEIVN